MRIGELLDLLDGNGLVETDGALFEAALREVGLTLDSPVGMPPEVAKLRKAVAKLRKAVAKLRKAVEAVYAHAGMVTSDWAADHAELAAVRSLINTPA